MEPETLDSLFHQDYGGYYDWMLTRDNPHSAAGGELYRNIQLNYEKMRRIALAEGYNAVWVVEADTIPPRDALSKLLAVDAPVVAGLYVLRHGAGIPNLMQYGQSLGIGTAMDWSNIKKEWGKTIPVSGGCMGCVVIRRTVLEAFSFITGEKGAPDRPMMEFCWANGFAQMARLDVVCGHKSPSGRVLWPEDYLNGDL